MRVFRQLRLVHLLLHCQDHDAVAQDRIIPESWLLTAYKRQWLTLLGVAASVDKGYFKVLVIKMALSSDLHDGNSSSSSTAERPGS